MEVFAAIALPTAVALLRRLFEGTELPSGPKPVPLPPQLPPTGRLFVFGLGFTG